MNLMCFILRLIWMERLVNDGHLRPSVAAKDCISNSTTKRHDKLIDFRMFRSDSKEEKPNASISCKISNRRVRERSQNVIHHGYIDNGSGRYVNVYASASQKKKKKKNLQNDETNWNETHQNDIPFLDLKK